EYKLFKSADSSGTADEDSTSSNINTGASANEARFGICSSATLNGAFWIDNIVEKGTSFPGPAANTYSISNTASMTPSGSINRAINRSLSASLNITGSIAKAINVATTNFTASLSFAGSVGKKMTLAATNFAGS